MDRLRKGIAIGMLFGSGQANVMTKTATENGVYTAADEEDPQTGEVYDPPKDGYSVFTVAVPLNSKSVSLSTSDVTGSQTAIFIYNPHNESPRLEGYSLFTIDLSGVKDDIEDYLQQISDLQDEVSGLEDEVSDLEDELKDCHDCRDEVVAFIQRYVPDYDPQPDECPAAELPELVQAVQPTLGAKFITANGTYLPASDNLDGYNQVVVDVPTWENCIQTIAAKLGLSEPYDCPIIVKKLDEEIGVYTFPEGTPINPILELVAGDPVTDEDSDLVVRWGFQTIARDGSGLRPLHLDRLSYTLSNADGPDSSGYIGFRVVLRVYQSDGTYVTEHQLPFEYTGSVGDILTIDNRSIDYTNGRTKFKGYKNGSLLEQGSYDYYNNDLIGYGDPAHTKKVKNA